MKKRIRRGLVWDKNLFCFSAVIALFSVYLLITPLSAGAYTPPIGIPDPGYWGTTHPIDSTAPTTCPTYWNNNPTLYKSGCYYVDNSNPSCSDSVNGNPNSLPRCSIPTSLSAGAYVEIHGGPYTTNADKDVGITIYANGAMAKPVWIRGPSIGPKAEIQMLITVKGQYVIMENLYWNNKADNLDNLLRFRSGAGGDVSYACIRNSKFEGSGNNLNYNGGLQAINIWSDTAGHVVNNIVVYNNEIFNLGDNNTTTENDYYGVKPEFGSSSVWILENIIYNMGGDGVQIGDMNNDPNGIPQPHHIYVGKNILYGSRENGVDVKRADDVIISQNTVHGPAFEAGIILHYQSNYVWVIFNEIHSLIGGIAAGGGVDNGIYYGSVNKAYFIGNLIYDIHDPNGDGNPTLWSPGAAIQVWDSGEVNIVNNTLFNYDIGISRPDPDYNDYPYDPRGPCNLINNIISNRRLPNGYDIIYNENDGHVPDQSKMDYNLLFYPYGPVRIYWDWYPPDPKDLAGFQAATGKGLNCIEADPLFVNPGLDFHLQSGSLAIDKGTSDPAYDTFLTRYGLSIARDIEGNVRPLPSGGNWDIGAYEYYTNDHPCRIPRTNTSYATLQAAYNAAANKDTIQALDLYLNQDLTANRSIAVTLVGGYSNDFTYDLGLTHLIGKLQIMNGSLTIKNFQLDK